MPFLYKRDLTLLRYHIYYLFGRQCISLASIFHLCWVIYYEVYLSHKHIMNVDAMKLIIPLIMKGTIFYFEPLAVIQTLKSHLGRSIAIL